MTNPNDVSSFYYDIVNSPLKGEEVVKQEIELIASLVPQKAQILDIGCGTGRHLIPLAKAGFDVMGIDSSPKMLDALKEKYPKAKVANVDILKDKTMLGKHDLVILMWNTFNEIAIKDSQAETLLKKLKELLNEGGKILINSDDVKNLNLEKFEFQTDVQVGEIMHRQIWKGKLIDREKRITDSLEKIELYNWNHSLIEKTQTTIRQRWWSEKEMLVLLEKKEFRVKLEKIKANNELYLVCSLK